MSMHYVSCSSSSSSPSMAQSLLASSSTATVVNSTNIMKLHHNTTQNTLNFILETFQCNISQEQAWALIYQSTKSLNDIIIDYERSENISELSIGKLTSFTDIIIDCNGNVNAGTWTTKTTLHLIKSDDKRLMNETINTLIASLATIVYSALEWNWRHSSCDEQLFKYNDDDDDEELDLEEDLELLMLSMFRGSENKDLVDEGYIDALEENCIHTVLSKCQIHFNELISTEKKNNAVLEMLSSSLNINKLGPDYYYRTVCKMMMDEALKLSKLVNQFCDNQNFDHQMNMLCSRSYPSLADTDNLKIWAQTWIKVMSELRFGVRLRPTPINDDHRTSSNSVSLPPMNELMEQIKIKRENLRKSSDSSSMQSSTPLYRSISFPEHQSLPIINQESIIECLKNLKPASRRNLLPLIVPEPCLHDRLMSAIRNRDYTLRPTSTIVKPCIKELYLKEKQACKEYCSLWNIYSSEKHYHPHYNKRKVSISGTVVHRSNSLSFNKFFQSIQDETIDYEQRQSRQSRSPYFMRSEIALNQFKESKKNFKRKRLSFKDKESNHHHYRTSTPKLNSFHSIGLLNLTSNHSSIDMNENLPHRSIIKHDLTNQQICNSFESLLVNSGSHQSFRESLHSNAHSLRSLNTISLNTFLRRSFVKRSNSNLSSNQLHRERNGTFNGFVTHQSNHINDESSELMSLKTFRSSFNEFWNRIFGSKNDSKLKME